MALIALHLGQQLCFSGLQREAVSAHQRAGLSRPREKTRALCSLQRPHGGQTLVLTPIPGIRGTAHGTEEGIHRLQFPEATRKMAIPVMYFNYVVHADTNGTRSAVSRTSHFDIRFVSHY